MPACIESDDRRGATRQYSTPRSVPSRLKPQELKWGGGLCTRCGADGGNAQDGLHRLKVDDEDFPGEIRRVWRAQEEERRREEADHRAAADTDHPDCAYRDGQRRSTISNVHGSPCNIARWGLSFWDQ